MRTSSFRDYDKRAHCPRPPLSAYLEDYLSPAQRELTERHIGGCERCSAQLAEMRQAMEQVSALGRATVPPEVVGAMLAQVDPMATLAGSGTLDAAEPSPTGRPLLWEDGVWRPAPEPHPELPPEPWADSQLRSHPAVWQAVEPEPEGASEAGAVPEPAEASAALGASAPALDATSGSVWDPPPPMPEEPAFHAPPVPQAFWERDRGEAPRWEAREDEPQFTAHSQADSIPPLRFDEEPQGLAGASGSSFDSAAGSRSGDARALVFAEHDAVSPSSQGADAVPVFVDPMTRIVVVPTGQRSDGERQAVWPARAAAVLAAAVVLGVGVVWSLQAGRRSPLAAVKPTSSVAGLTTAPRATATAVTATATPAPTPAPTPTPAPPPPVAWREAPQQVQPGIRIKPNGAQNAQGVFNPRVYEIVFDLTTADQKPPAFTAGRDGNAIVVRIPGLTTPNGQTYQAPASAPIVSIVPGDGVVTINLRTEVPFETWSVDGPARIVVDLKR